MSHIAPSEDLNEKEKKKLKIYKKVKLTMSRG